MRNNVGLGLPKVTLSVAAAPSAISVSLWSAIVWSSWYGAVPLTLMLFVSAWEASATNALYLELSMGVFGTAAVPAGGPKRLSRYGAWVTPISRGC